MKSCWIYLPWRWKFFKLYFWVQDQKLWNIPPQYLVEIWENLLFHVLSNDECKFAINLFLFTWGPCENVNLLYFLLKIQIWNGCNVFNIAGIPIKDISVNLSFLSSRWKVVEYTPPEIGKFVNCISEFRIKSCGIYPPKRHLVLHCSALWVWLLSHLIPVFSFVECALLSILGVILDISWQ